MNFEQMVSNCKSRACIISVESYSDGTYGNIRIVAANEAHCADAEKTFQRKFVPDSPYYYYLPQDKNFEDFMYRSACLGQPLHTYVHLEQMGLWVNMFLMPLASDKENVGYCLYYYDITPYADSEQQASLAADTAASTLETCIKLRGAQKENIDAVFKEIIEDLRKLCCAEHCCILLSDSENQEYSVFCEATNPNSTVNPMEIYNTERFNAVANSFDSIINGSSCVIIKDENDMKWLESINPDCHSLLVESSVRSVVLFPLHHSSQFVGYLWALNFKTEDVVKIKETLELSTFFIASEIANYQMMNKLEILSSIDLMTGCKNRNAMNNAVNDIVSGKTQMTGSYAVIFIDLNGLKRINDESGHSAGDRLLRTASAILGQVFCDCDIYRAGGDEFMLIAPQYDEEKLKGRLRQLNEKSTIATDVEMAVGYCFVNEGDDIRKAMQTADERMYKNKEEFYTLHPEQKYRK